MSSAPHSAAPNPAIYYEPEGFSTNRTNLMGRHSATEGFLRGYLHNAGPLERLYCYARAPEQATDFAARCQHFGYQGEIVWLPMTDPASPARAGILLRYDAVLGTQAWRRRRLSQRAYSLCGVTHTTAGGAIDSLVDLLTAPLQDWDALICTSTCVRATVEQVLDEQSAYLAARFGASRFPRPQLPVIPLGINCADFSPDPGIRPRWRQELGIGDQDIVFLFVGRLSFHAKAHPLPMYLGLEEAARRTGRTVHLIQAGWFANESLEKAFREGAALFCPSVKTLFLDGRQPDVRRHIWAASDVFISLSDNVQETFGLTPIEAMAAGLPVVVSDWDGYRETVRHGVDGFRIPTVMPPSPLGSDLIDHFAAGLDSYDRFCAYSSQLVAVDAAAVSEACIRLIANPELRRQMGQAGQQRAQELYDWQVIIPRYQELWRELTTRRIAGSESAPCPAGREPHPARPDPFAAFASYPTRTLGLDHQIALIPGASLENARRRITSPLASFAQNRFLTEKQVAAILYHLAAHGACPAQALVEAVATTPAEEAALFRGLVWLAKLHLISATPPPGAPG